MSKEHTPDGEFKHESLQDGQTIHQYLEALAAGFQNARLELNSDGDGIVLHPDGLLKLTVKAKRKGDRCKLHLRLNWREKGPEELPKKRAPLLISGAD